MADEVQFNVSKSTVVRGLEKRTIAKWESGGWELVSESPGTLRTELTFRRPKPKTPWKLLAGVGGAMVVIIAAIGIGSSLNAQDDAEAAAAQDTTASTPTPEATDSAADSTESADPESEPAAAPATWDPDAATADLTLTAENNADLAALLSGPSDGPDVEQFAETYAGEIIEFDGSIGAMAPHGDYDTRHDILVVYGDYSETTSSGGPLFQFRDVNTTSDLNYVGDNVPDTVGVGDNIRVTARVLEFDSVRLLFQLEPVATRFR